MSETLYLPAQTSTNLKREMTVISFLSNQAWFGTLTEFGTLSEKPPDAFNELSVLRFLILGSVLTVACHMRYAAGTTILK